ncbi:MAG: AMP-binding protein [bacterium]
MAMTFGSFITAHARKYPQETAAICEDKALTYRDLDLRSNRLANALREGGIRIGCRASRNRFAPS